MLTDADSIAEAQRRMNDAALALAKMAPEVATAKQVKEYDGERRKRALAVFVMEQLKQEKMSTSLAEHAARASDGWGASLNDLGEQLKSALRVIETHDATMILYESSRSVLSMEKAKIGI